MNLVGTAGSSYQLKSQKFKGKTERRKDIYDPFEEVDVLRRLLIVID
jgi:hypothetical protein